MKQTVSAPVAVIVLVLAVAVGLVVLGRQQPQHSHEDEVFVLPFEPPVEERELSILRKGLMPLGIAVVMPPLGDDRFKGARVAVVLPGSPAERGGLKAGDLILRFNDVGTGNPFALVAAVAEVDPEKENEVVVERAGEELALVITGVTPLSPEEVLK